MGFLLEARDVFSFSTLWKLCIPVIIVLIGIRLIAGTFIKKSPKTRTNFDKGGKAHFVLFSGSDVDYSNKGFDGNSLTAVFGGIDCHLENAIIDHDVTIDVTAVFGGVEICLPSNVNVEVSSVSFFGGVDNARRRAHIEGIPTVYIKASAIFGGVDIL